MRIVLIPTILALAAALDALAQEIPRTPDRKADFQGVWSGAWITPLERPTEASALVVAEADAGALVDTLFGLHDKRDPLGPTHSLDYRQLMPVRGELRSSMIIEPADGRLPYTEAALNDLRPPPAPGLDGPEGRPVSERCLVKANGEAPFMTLPAGNIKQIVQTPDHLVILSETNSKLRIIPLRDDAPGPAHQGRGRWDGDAIVVETKGFAPSDRVRATSFVNFAISPQTVITERFERASADEIVYSYTVADPTLYKHPWRAEMSLKRSDQRLYEWGCHEANYSMTHMLRGARLQEQRESGRKP